MAGKGGLLGSGFRVSGPKCRDAVASTSEAATHPEDRSNVPESSSEEAVLI
jgi:hypothetical protein